MNEPKTDSVDETTQVVQAGAVVPLTDSVITHGILFAHPELPPFKMFLQLDLEKKTVTKYHFEIVARASEKVERFFVDVVPDAQPVPPAQSLLKPKTPGLIVP